MVTKVFITPSWYDEKDTGQGGIKRVWEALVKYLPEFGIEVVRNHLEADIIHTHGGQLVNVPGIPSVNTNHGLMWSRYPWGENYEEVNKDVVEAMRRAVAHTAPSHWVAVSLRRGMLVYPEIIYHGVDADEWVHNETHQGYVLWNKARADMVSNPNDMQEVAQKLGDIKFLTTIGQPTPNVEVIGVMSYEEMKLFVMRAGVYLCTARETMGINTLEALAAGVPVAGWNWGGQHEIIRQGETGYLATPGKYDELADCIRKCLEERERLSKNAIEDIRERWRWRPRIQQYADIFKRVHRYYSNPRPKVSVVVTAYNLDKYLPECLESIRTQTFGDFECLVIDDALSSSTQEIVNHFTDIDNRFKYRRPPHNLGLPGARNFGLTLAKALYIRHMDADDRLKPNALELETKALDEDWGTHIVYGHLELISEDGSPQKESNGDIKRSGWPPDHFSWRQQMAHLNQLPSTCMVRRSVFERSGGYRDRMKRNEDAEFWCRVTSLGFRAKKITQSATMEHRMREDSKGATEWKNEGTEPDWTAWFPWRLGAGSGGDGIRLLRETGGKVPYPNLVPFGAQGKPPEGKKCWPAHDYSYPNVTIIITVGPGHEKYLRDALDSVLSQTYPDWECYVVNDTGKEWKPNNYWDSPLAGYPWANYVSTLGNFGVSRARNVGAKFARGRALIWLDADDYWLPWTLEKMIATLEVNNGIIYSDHLINQPGKELIAAKSPEFDCKNLISKGSYPGSSVLVPRWVYDIVLQKQQGWDEQIPGYEDWDFQIAIAAHTHVCAYHIEEPLFIYRFLPDGNRERHKRHIDDIIAYVDQKWEPYRSGREELMCDCQNKRKNTSPASKYSSSGVKSDAPTAPSAITEQTVLIEYRGEAMAPITIAGPITRTPYRFANQGAHQRKFVYAEDAREFLGQRNENGNPIFVRVQEENRTENPDLEAFLVPN